MRACVGGGAERKRGRGRRRGGGWCGFPEGGAVSGGGCRAQEGGGLCGEDVRGVGMLGGATAGGVSGRERWGEGGRGGRAPRLGGRLVGMGAARREGRRGEWRRTPTPAGRAPHRPACLRRYRCRPRRLRRRCGRGHRGCTRGGTSPHAVCPRHARVPWRCRGSGRTGDGSRRRWRHPVVAATPLAARPPQPGSPVGGGDLLTTFFHRSIALASAFLRTLPHTAHASSPVPVFFALRHLFLSFASLPWRHPARVPDPRTPLWPERALGVLCGHAPPHR